MTTKNTIEIEKNLLLDGIKQRYSYDFSHYSIDMMNRRIDEYLTKLQLKNVSLLTHKILHDKELFHDFLKSMSITVTSFFRDPDFYLSVRKHVIPVLKSYPYFKIWHAGCATGEEVYSMAILLHEEGLLDRSYIYGTDFNVQALKMAGKGIFPKMKLEESRENYIRAGGKKDFSHYITENMNSFKINSPLQKTTTFAAHNLVTDQKFGEMNVVFCRNVLIYFDRELQSRVVSLFRDSLCYYGFLCLGSCESLEQQIVKSDFNTIDVKNKLYQKMTK